MMSIDCLIKTINRLKKQSSFFLNKPSASLKLVDKPNRNKNLNIISKYLLQVNGCYYKLLHFMPTVLKT